MDRIIEKKKWWKTKKFLYLLLLLLVVVFLFSFLLGGNESTVYSSYQKVTIDTVHQGIFQEFIPIDGMVQPIKTIVLDAVEGGRVEEKYVEEGAMVQKGEPILRLANNDLQLDFLSKETSLLDQLNNMRNTRISLEQTHLQLQQQLLDVERSFLESYKNYTRSKKLMNDKVLAAAEFEKVEDDFQYLLKKKNLLQETVRRDSAFKQNQIKQLESSANLIERNLEMVKNSLENLVVKAPISGQLSALQAEYGENKQKGQNLGQIDVLEGYKVKATVDEHYISRVVCGQRGEFLFDGKMYFLKIIKILPQVSNGLFKIEFNFEGALPQGIKNGQSLQIRLALSDRSTKLLVKRGGFYQKTGGMWIYRIENNVATKHELVLGRQNPDYYEVTDGLKIGDRVVVSSYDVFGDAEKIILQNEK